MNALEALGNERLAYLQLLGEYRKLLGLIGQLKAGEVPLEAVELLPGDAWRINLTIDASNLKIEPAKQTGSELEK